MPLSLVLMALSLPLTRPIDCPRPVAPDEAAARRIAEREISARPRTGVNYFVLNIVADDRDHPGQWLAYQSVVPGPGRPTRGGGGIQMNIDRCTGAVSNLHYSR